MLKVYFTLVSGVCNTPRVTACLSRSSQSTLMVGRAERQQTSLMPSLVHTSDVEIESPACSRQHCTIGLPPDILTLGEVGVDVVDVGSVNGTFINFARLQPGVVYRMVDGDTIIFGGGASIEPHEFIAEALRDDPRLVVWQFHSQWMSSAAPLLRTTAAAETAGVEPQCEELSVMNSEIVRSDPTPNNDDQGRRTTVLQHLVAQPSQANSEVRSSKRSRSPVLDVNAEFVSRRKTSNGSSTANRPAAIAVHSNDNVDVPPSAVPLVAEDLKPSLSRQAIRAALDEMRSVGTALEISWRCTARQAERRKPKRNGTSLTVQPQTGTSSSGVWQCKVYSIGRGSVQLTKGVDAPPIAGDLIPFPLPLRADCQLEVTGIVVLPPPAASEVTATPRKQIIDDRCGTTGQGGETDLRYDHSPRCCSASAVPVTPPPAPRATDGARTRKPAIQNLITPVEGVTVGSVSFVPQTVPEAARSALIFKARRPLNAPKGQGLVWGDIWCLRCTETHVSWLMPDVEQLSNHQREGRGDAIDEAFFKGVKVSMLSIPVTSIASLHVDRLSTCDGLTVTLKPHCRIPLLPESLFSQRTSDGFQESVMFRLPASTIIEESCKISEFYQAWLGRSIPVEVHIGGPSTIGTSDRPT